MEKFENNTNYYLLHEDEYRVIRNNQDVSNIYGLPKEELTSIFVKKKIMPFGAHIMAIHNNGEQYWSNIHQDYLLRNEKVLDEVHNIMKLVNTNTDIKLVLYENFGTVILTNECLACFSSGDVDIYGFLEHKASICETLIKDGYSIEPRRAVSDKIMTTFHKSKSEEKPFFINIEWKPIARKYVRRMDKLERRMIQFRKTNVIRVKENIDVLDQTALLYFNLLHLSIGHYYLSSPDIRLYVDVDRLIRSKLQIDYSKLIKWASEDNQQIRILTASILAHDLLNTPLMINREKFDRKTNKYSQKILKFLRKNRKIEFGVIDGVLSQIIIDAYSEGQSVIGYIIERIFRKNNS